MLAFVAHQLVFIHSDLRLAFGIGQRDVADVQYVLNLLFRHFVFGVGNRLADLDFVRRAFFDHLQPLLHRVNCILQGQCADRHAVIQQILFVLLALVSQFFRLGRNFLCRLYRFFAHGCGGSRQPSHLRFKRRARGRRGVGYFALNARHFIADSSGGDAGVVYVLIQYGFIN